MYPRLPETNTVEAKMERYEETQRELGTHRQAFLLLFSFEKLNRCRCRTF
jgi:hypothetical protein